MLAAQLKSWKVTRAIVTVRRAGVAPVRSRRVPPWRRRSYGARPPPSRPPDYTIPPTLYRRGCVSWRGAASASIAHFLDRRQRGLQRTVVVDIEVVVERLEGTSLVKNHFAAAGKAVERHGAT